LRLSVGVHYVASQTTAIRWSVFWFRMPGRFFLCGVSGPEGSVSGGSRSEGSERSVPEGLFVHGGSGPEGSASGPRMTSDWASFFLASASTSPLLDRLVADPRKQIPNTHTIK
jgi:hypothetical protein